MSSKRIDLGELRAGQRLRFSGTIEDDTDLTTCAALVCSFKRWEDDSDADAIAQVDVTVLSATEWEVVVGSDETKDWEPVPFRYDVQIEPNTAETSTPQWGRIEVARRITGALSVDYTCSPPMVQSAAAIGAPTGLPDSTSATAAFAFTVPSFGDATAIQDQFGNPAVHASAPALFSPRAIRFDVFGVLPPARAVYWPWERIVGDYTGAVGFLVRSGGDTFNAPVAQGLGSLLDEAECASLSAGATGAKRLRWQGLLDQSGNAYHLTDYGSDLPKFYDPALGGMLTTNGVPTMAFTGPANAAQATATTVRRGNNTGDPLQWDPSYLLDFSGNPAITIAWVGNVIDDGQAGGLARYMFAMGEFFGSGVNADHQGLGMSAAFPTAGAGNAVLNITLGPDAAGPPLLDRHLQYFPPGAWETLQHIVLVRDAGARWDATRVYQNGVLLTPVAGSGSTDDQLTLGPSEYGATSIGANAYMQQFYTGNFRGAIVWGQAFAHGSSELTNLFAQLDARIAP